MKMVGDFLLDTNILIAFFNNDQRVVSNIKNADVIYIPSIVVGELYFGAYKSVQVDKNILKIEQILGTMVVRPVEADTAKIFGEIKSSLKKKGTPIPENDIWIAATAIQNSLPLVTRDKHFDNIESLQLISW